MKIETLPTDKLIPYARNAKKHSDTQVASIAASIREFGFCNPVLIDKDDGIIAGHGRVLAAQKLALEKVPCIRLGHLTDNQRRAYILADNRLAETGGGWDVDMLKLEFSEIEWADLKGFDIDDLEFDEFRDEMIPEKIKDDELFELKIRPFARMAWALIGLRPDQFGTVQSFIDTLPKSAIIRTTLSDNEGQPD